ncbi:Clp protease N-terminal domain-containing protein [Kribbella sp. DT2]|uniref:Clp protease N-terminal domain-containing protein n=1 Tax=Kribbella sp. DT2 TaxID=3393427 RepID=UPI003CE81A8D
MNTAAKDVRAVLVRGAREEAQREGSPTIEPEHVLLALIGLDGTATARLLAAAGLTRTAVREALDREWEQSLAVAGVRIDVGQLPSATPEPGRKPRIGESTVKLLKRSMDASGELSGGRITAAHLLVGVLDTKLGRVSRVLDLLSVDRAPLRAEVVASANRGER